MTFLGFLASGSGCAGHLPSGGTPAHGSHRSSSYLPATRQQMIQLGRFNQRSLSGLLDGVRPVKVGQQDKRRSATHTTWPTRKVTQFFCRLCKLNPTRLLASLIAVRNSDSRYVARGHHLPRPVRAAGSLVGWLPVSTGVMVVIGYFFAEVSWQSASVFMLSLWLLPAAWPSAQQHWSRTLGWAILAAAPALLASGWSAWQMVGGR
jgi:uncharacterized membrane protein